MPNQKPRVFITRKVPDVVLEMLQDDCDLHVWDKLIPPPRPKLLDELALADGIIPMLTEIMDTEAFDAAPKLKVVSNYAVGVDNIDVQEATQRGIPVGNTPGVLTDATADLAVTLLLAAARRIPESMQYVNNGDWQTWSPTAMLGKDVSGATAGIIGLGRIGYAFAKRAAAFDMRILYYGGSNAAYAESVGAKAVDLPTLLRESDYVSLHVPLKDDTRHMIGADELAQMKNDAILINTARGGVVDSAALRHALQNSVIGAAALDVTDPEPISPDDPLLTLSNCIVVPHIGSATIRTRERMGIIAAENLLAGLRGDPLPHTVNPKVMRRT